MYENVKFIYCGLFSTDGDWIHFTDCPITSAYIPKMESYHITLLLRKVPKSRILAPSFFFFELRAAGKDI